jgi:CheY-like chemotaxis protein
MIGMTEKLVGKTVLLVDDDERNTYALSSYLEILEMNIIIAKDGADAIEKLTALDEVNIILLDMMMPIMDGFEVLAAIRTNPLWQDIPVISVTAKAMKGDREKCLESGAWDYIAKPLDMNQLVNKMVQWIR